MFKVHGDKGNLLEQKACKGKDAKIVTSIILDELCLVFVLVYAAFLGERGEVGQTNVLNYQVFNCGEKGETEVNYQCLKVCA